MDQVIMLLAPTRGGEMGNFLISVGTVANLLGLVLLLDALTITFASGEGAVQTFINMQLMHLQMLEFFGGCAAMIYGIISIVGGVIIQRSKAKN